MNFVTFNQDYSHLAVGMSLPFLLVERAQVPFAG